jgi:hypothetical protein
VTDVLGCHDAELSSVAAHGVDQLRPLPHQQLAHREHDRFCLLLGLPHRHARHTRP